MGDRVMLGSSPAMRKFRAYKPSRKMKLRTFRKKEGAVDRMKSIWRKIPEWDDDKINCLFANLSYSPKDVEKFCLVLPEFQDESEFPYHAGLFLSKLVEHGSSDSYRLSFRHLERPVSLLTCNGKQLVVDGDVGELAGLSMDSGHLIINGDANSYLGRFLCGGRITVNGNVYGEAGYRMESGSIRIKGILEGDVGSGMLGGHVVIDKNVRGLVGFAKDCDPMEGGLIIVKGNVVGVVGEALKGGKIIIAGKFNGNRNYIGPHHAVANGRDTVGSYMGSGLIMICGNVSGVVGYHMKGGLIVIKGKCKNISANAEGKIIHEGRIVRGG